MKIFCQKKKNKTQKEKAFTAIELLVVVLIVGIIASIATPSMKGWIGSIKAQSRANSILSGLNKARVEALTRNMPIVFSLNATGYWQYGCVNVNTDSASAAYCPSSKLERSDDLITNNDVTIAIAPSSNGYVVFNSLGMATTSSTYGAARMTDVRVSSGSKLYTILLRSGGSAKMCTGACT